MDVKTSMSIGFQLIIYFNCIYVFASYLAAVCHASILEPDESKLAALAWCVYLAVVINAQHALAQVVNCGAAGDVIEALFALQQK